MRANGGPRPGSLCLSVGAVLAVEDTVPDSVTAEPADDVSTSYEAGVVDVRFLRPSTVAVTVNREVDPFTIAVVVR